VSQQVRGAGRVLRDVSFDVGPGRLTVIAGSSGAGKTILLQTLAGLRAPAEGEVLHDGVQPGPPGPEFGFVPQEDIIHRELPLRRTLVYAAGLRMPPGTAAETVAARVDRVLEILGLSRRAGTPVRGLSGGERKRASVAVELLTRPRVLFLDEPTSGLDPVTGAALLRNNVRRPASSWPVRPATWACTRSMPMRSIHSSPAVTSGMDRKFTVPSSKAASSSARTCHWAWALTA
jgi:ABC-type multidrug transport system ATPase subunit